MIRRTTLTYTDGTQEIIDHGGKLTGLFYPTKLEDFKEYHGKLIAHIKSEAKTHWRDPNDPYVIDYDEDIKHAPMTATLTIDFEDGTQEKIELDKAIELKLSDERLKSIEFRECKNGKWIMSYASHLFKGRKFTNVHCSKEAR